MYCTIDWLDIEGCGSHDNLGVAYINSLLSLAVALLPRETEFYDPLCGLSWLTSTTLHLRNTNSLKSFISYVFRTLKYMLVGVNDCQFDVSLLKQGGL